MRTTAYFYLLAILKILRKDILSFIFCMDGLNGILEMAQLMVSSLKRGMIIQSQLFWQQTDSNVRIWTSGNKGHHSDVSYSEEFQAAYIESMWNALKANPTISGGILWTWADYFHESHFALTTSYAPYGVVTGDRQPKKALEALARMYGGSIPTK
jgi:hypothetical protein